MDKQELDQAIGEVPPSTVNVDAVIARERRAALVRRVANPWVATAAGVVAVTFGVAVAMLPSNSDGAPVISGSQPTSRPSSSSPVPPPTCILPPTEPTGDAGVRLTEALNTVVREHLAPEAQLVPNPGAQDPLGSQRGPLEFYHLPGDGTGTCGGDVGYFLAMTNVVHGKANGNIVAIMQPPGNHGYWPPECAGRSVDPSEIACNRTVEPDGSIVVAATHANEGGSTTYRVDVAKTDGTYLALIAENVAGTSKTGRSPDGPAPPLTIEQLITIALNENLTLYPVR